MRKKFDKGAKHYFSHYLPILTYWNFACHFSFGNRLRRRPFRRNHHGRRRDGPRHVNRGPHAGVGKGGEMLLSFFVASGLNWSHLWWLTSELIQDVLSLQRVYVQIYFVSVAMSRTTFACSRLEFQLAFYLHVCQRVNIQLASVGIFDNHWLETELQCRLPFRTLIGFWSKKFFDKMRTIVVHLWNHCLASTNDCEQNRDKISSVVAFHVFFLNLVG